MRTGTSGATFFSEHFVLSRSSKGTSRSHILEPNAPLHGSYGIIPEDCRFPADRPRHSQKLLENDDF